MVARMIIDCGSCAAHGQGCVDCVVTFLTVPGHATGRGGSDVHGGVTAGGAVDLDAAERGAIGVLARSGLVPPLRLRRVG